MREYVGVDWGEQAHHVWVEDASGVRVLSQTVAQTAEGFAEFGRWLDERRAQGVELWAGIERPDGRMVEFLLDHGVVVCALNPKMVARAREQFRMSQVKNDALDAHVTAYCVRTRHAELRPLRPSSEELEELKLMTRDHLRLVRQRTRVLNQLTLALKEYYPLALELFADLSHASARRFLREYPTPAAAQRMREVTWQAFARRYHLADPAARWAQLRTPQLAVPAHVVRARQRTLQALLEQLEVLVRQAEQLAEEIERFFAGLPVATLVATLPGSRSGVILPAIWAEIGDGAGRWTSWGHLQAEAGAVPVTVQSSRSRAVHFRFACNKRLRYYTYMFARVSRIHSEWARCYYRRQRARGHNEHRALRALAAKWLKIFFVLWSRGVPYDEATHLKTIGRQAIRQVA